MWEVALLLVLGVAGAWVWSSITAHEKAIAVARYACARHGQQLLDETVAQVRVALLRTANGPLLPKRTYRFEFTGDGDVRHGGELSLHAGRVVALHLELGGFTLYDHEDAVAEQDVTAPGEELKQNERDSL